MANKDVYTGDFRNDQFHGHGELAISKGRVFSGVFKEGQAPNHGCISYEDGSVYTGTVM